MHCLIIGKVWPEPTATAAGRRIKELIAALSAEGARVTFACAAQESTHSLDLRGLGVETSTVRPNDPSFDPWIIQLNPDVVIFDRFMIEEQFGWRVEKSCPQALRVLETSDLHCLRSAREEALKAGEALNLKNAVAVREIASIYRSDLALIISEFEVELLSGFFHVPANQVQYWPFYSAGAGKAWPEYQARDHFILMGSFMHSPNLDAVRWCINEIWPHIHKRLPGAELHCYGSYGEKYATELHRPRSGIYFKGRAEDALSTIANYRVNLAPLRFGAGLKGKVFDGFESDTPTISTPIGAEGIAEASAWFGIAENDPEQFALKAMDAFSKVDFWETLREQGRSILRERFNATFWKPRLFGILSRAKETLVANRSRNFTGQMLRHHHQRSTEYMSRWIEAKNKSV